MKEFIWHIQRNRRAIIESYEDASAFCSTLLHDEAGALPARIREGLGAASADERDYAIACAYALFLEKERRKELSAYFTPPSLARAALEASEPFLKDIEHPTVLDPACGGGSFLTPVARSLIEKRRKQGMRLDNICKDTLKSIRGIEIDPGLAALSQTLLRKMLEREYGFKRPGPLGVVHRGDALSSRAHERFDLVIGNPPYGKVRSKVSKKSLKNAGLANLGGHTNFYSLFVLYGLDHVKPGGGLVYVLPTSFVAGPYFAGLRQEIISRAEVARIDLHELRENLFVGAVQDVCLLTLRKRSEGALASDLSHEYELGFIDAEGKRTACGSAKAKTEGEPWTLPVAHEVRVFAPRKAKSVAIARHTLDDYGYKVRVGKVVPNREGKFLKKKKEGLAVLPLVWASNIRPDGSFFFWSSRRLGNAPWYKPPTPKNTEYATTKPAVIVQRTSNRDQSRRLNAAVVPTTFRERHRRGFVAENHVIIVEAKTARPRVPLSKVAALLNSGIVNERFSAVSGSFSVSAKLLQRMALPDRELVRKLSAEEFEHGLRQLFEGLGDVLAPGKRSEGPSDAKDGVDKSRKLKGGGVDENACLKRRAVA
jgi:adenine-specific DNA-methyltransferase